MGGGKNQRIVIITAANCDRLTHIEAGRYLSVRFFRKFRRTLTATVCNSR